MRPHHASCHEHERRAASALLLIARGGVISTDIMAAGGTAVLGRLDHLLLSAQRGRHRSAAEACSGQLIEEISAIQNSGARYLKT